MSDKTIIYLLFAAGLLAAPAARRLKPGSLPDEAAPPQERSDAKPAKTSDATQEEFWYGLKPDGVTAIRIVSDFSLKQIAPDRNYLHQVSARTTPVHPLSDKKGNSGSLFNIDAALVRESRKLESLTEFKPTGMSVEYRWNVERPGKDVLYIKPKKEIFLPDRNRLFAFYVRGAGHAHQVFALFRGPNKIAQEIFICSLDFQGWKRFEVVIPPYLRLRNPLKHNRFELYFQGLKVQSYFRDQAGMSVFNLAEMFILADTSDKKIPGADMKDNF